MKDKLFCNLLLNNLMVPITKQVQQFGMMKQHKLNCKFGTSEAQK